MAGSLFRPYSWRIKMCLVWLSFGRFCCITVVVAQLYTWGMSQPSRIHSSSKVTVWCDFQPALPLLLAPASSPRRPSIPTLGDTGAETGRSRGQRWRVNVYWHFVPSLWDNQASESKLSSVWTAGPRERHCRADLCPHLHMFSIYNFVSTVKYLVKQCIENQF